MSNEPISIIPAISYKTLPVTDATYTVTAAQSGCVFDNTGAVATVDFDMPTATIGMEYTFIREATQIITLDPFSGENFAGSEANVKKRLNADGSYIYIKCIRTGIWHVMASYGVVVDE